jgi:hypothetical protein
VLKPRLPARGYHGTTLEAATNIVNNKDFEREEREWHWLGQGVYFWQDAPLRAWEWAQHKAGEETANGRPVEPAVVSAVIDLKECLDFLDIRFWPLLDLAWQRVSRRHIDEGGEPPNQIGPLEALACAAFIELHGNAKEPIPINMQLLKLLAPTVWARVVSSGEPQPSEVALSNIVEDAKRRYGRNRRDCEVIDAAVQILGEHGAPVCTVRAAFMEGDEPYASSWFRDRSHVQIAIVRPGAITMLVSELRIEDSDQLKRDYETAQLHKTAWTRKMKP